MAAEPINNLAAELKANRNLLAALAGPSIAVTVEAEQGFKPVRMTAEDLTRVLINLVKNSAEAMPAGGWIHLGLLSERAANLQTRHGAGADAGSSLLLTVEDNGPGISGKALDQDLRLRLHHPLESRERRLARNPPRSRPLHRPLDRRRRGRTHSRRQLDARRGRALRSSSPYSAAKRAAND